MRALVLLSLLGCIDDRKRVASDVFVCNAGSHTADVDCGDGYRCYSGVQALGASVCVPACDPADPKTCPDGVCTVGHECLKGCRVETANSCGTAASGLLSCVRINYAPASQSGNDGVCTPVNFTCTESKDCTSQIFDVCTSEAEGQQYNDALPKSGSICAQGNCQAFGIACEPGSTCVKNVLPSAGDRAPDVCAPNCQLRTLPGGGTALECLPGFGCLSDIFPQTTTHVCVPGVAGWVCNNTLACSAGTCEPWSEVGDPYSGFKTCSPDCASDADCLFFDQGPDNPNMLSHFSCIAGHCRQLQSVFFMGVCVRDGDECQLDPDAKCKNPTASPPPVSCDFMQSMMGTALAAGPACTRDCTSDDECATLSQNSHVTWACNKMVGTCQPSLPYIFQCTDDKSCAPTLNCLPPPGAPDTYKVCTHACNSSDDCAKNPGLGGNFACALGVCAPKTSSGCMPPAQFADLCLSGQLGSNGLCLSPPGWVCDTPERCLSGNCSNGHCQ